MLVATASSNTAPGSVVAIISIEKILRKPGRCVCRACSMDTIRAAAHTAATRTTTKPEGARKGRGRGLKMI